MIRACIWKTPMKITCCYLKNKRETQWWRAEESWYIANAYGRKRRLFFYQLIFPICDTKNSGVHVYERMPYYSNLGGWSNIYTCQPGLGGSYGYNFKNMKLTDIVNHDAYVVTGGVHGGSGGAIYRWWMTGSDYNDETDMSINLQCWLQVKHINKLCKKYTEKKRGEEGYDTCCKFYYIWKFLVQSVNFLTEEDNLDLCGDETIWSTDSYSEARAGVTISVNNKPVVTKWVQTVILSDVSHIRPRAYM